MQGGGAGEQLWVGNRHRGFGLTVGHKACDGADDENGDADLPLRKFAVWGRSVYEGGVGGGGKGDENVEGEGECGLYWRTYTNVKSHVASTTLICSNYTGPLPQGSHTMDGFSSSGRSSSVRLLWPSFITF